MNQSNTVSPAAHAKLMRSLQGRLVSTSTPHEQAWQDWTCHRPSRLQHSLVYQKLQGELVSMLGSLSKPGRLEPLMPLPGTLAVPDWSDAWTSALLHPVPGSRFTMSPVGHCCIGGLG